MPPQQTIDVVTTISGPAPDLETFASQVDEACRQVAMVQTQAVAPRVESRRLFRKTVRPDFGESFRLLALTVSQMAAVTPLDTLLVMGAYPRDGRTTVAANLSMALAGMGRRVVLVDADTRRPRLAQLLDVDVPVAATTPSPAPPTGNGHASSLVGPLRNGERPHASGTGATSPLAVAPTDLAGLVLVQPLPGNEATLGSETMAHLLGAMRSVADFVILDSPPCLPYADAFFLAPLAHGVLYVVRRRQQDVEAQGRIQAQLTRLGANVIAAVFNDA